MTIAEMKAAAQNRNNNMQTNPSTNPSTFGRLASALGKVAVAYAKDTTVNVIGNAALKAEPYIDRLEKKADELTKRLEARASTIENRSAAQPQR